MGSNCGMCGSAAEVTTCFCREHTKRYGVLCISCRMKLHPGTARAAVKRAKRHAAIVNAGAQLSRLHDRGARAQHDTGSAYATDAERELELVRNEDAPA